MARDAGSNGACEVEPQKHDPVVSFVADDAYVMPLAAAISSVMANLAENCALDIAIVDAGITPEHKAKINRLADGCRIRIGWLEPSEAQRETVASLPVGFVGRSCYFKMLIPDLLGESQRRAIYLDSDVIVESDISALWTMAFNGNAVLAARDMLNPCVSSPFGVGNWKALGRDSADPLFNSGVLVMNCVKWRQDDIFGKLVAYLHDSYQHVRLCDQDALNAVLGRSWGRLDPLWNVLPRMKTARRYSLFDKARHEALVEKARALHFCGPGKPWEYLCSHPRRDRFFHYLDQTSWAGWRPKATAICTNTFSYYTRRMRRAANRAAARVKMRRS